MDTLILLLVHTLQYKKWYTNTCKADIGGMAGFMLGMSVATIVALIDSVWFFARYSCESK